MKLTSLVYLERGGDYLMLHRVKKKQDVNQDKWIGVGGKFLEGESPQTGRLKKPRDPGINARNKEQPRRCGTALRKCCGSGRDDR